MVKIITSINTLRALIRDEHMASTDYYQLSIKKDTPERWREALRGMSNDEARHKEILKSFLRTING
jgi:uncharacterized protein (UPF0262 family)